MARPSDPLLALLRRLLDERGMNTARLAEQTQITRPRARKILAGTEPMLVDELLRIGEALKLSPADLGLAAGTIPVGEPEGDHSAAAAGLADANHDDALDFPEASLDRKSEPTVDPWGNQPEQLFRIAFGLGCDFFFLVDTQQIEDSGVPKHVLTSYAGRELPIRLDAAYHAYNEPRYSENSVTLTLSFDALYECTFPWGAIKQFVLFPATPDEPPAEELDDDSEEAPRQTSHLRLVT